jgi:hypothetical protein
MALIGALDYRKMKSCKYLRDESFGIWGFFSIFVMKKKNLFFVLDFCCGFSMAL